MPNPSVSMRVAQVLAAHTSTIFGVMGNGNAFFIDAAEAAGVSFIAVRHEGAAVPAADAYFRVSGKLASATTTYGPGFTNAVTGLAEAVHAQIPVILITGDAPAAGPRPKDVDQGGVASSVGAPTFTVGTGNAASVTQQAIDHAMTFRTAVVLAIPYDLATAEITDEHPLPEIVRTQPSLQDPQELEAVASLLAAAQRPLILAGRGAHLAGAGKELQFLAERLGALTASTALARNIFPSQAFDLGIAGGFGTDEAAHLMAKADVVLVVGARLTPFTMRFGELLNDSAQVIQIDTSNSPTHSRVDTFLRGDARETVHQIADILPNTPVSPTWQGVSTTDVRNAQERHPGDTVAADGLLDPRTLAAALNGILPANRTIVQDGGHFIGWAPMYWDIAAPNKLVMVGTAYESIGLGLASAVGAATADPDATTVLVTGDGGLLMALADLESVVRVMHKGIIVVFNDCAYGAEIHQYASRGVTRHPMTIPDVDFAGMARALGAQGATIRSLEDLSRLQEWVAAGEEGVFLIDCRVSPTVCAPYMQEIIRASAKNSTPQLSSL